MGLSLFEFQVHEVLHGGEGGPSVRQGAYQLLDPIDLLIGDFYCFPVRFEIGLLADEQVAALSCLRIIHRGKELLEFAEQHAKLDSQVIGGDEGGGVPAEDYSHADQESESEPLRTSARHPADISQQRSGRGRFPGIHVCLVHEPQGARIGRSHRVRPFGRGSLQNQMQKTAPPHTPWCCAMARRSSRLVRPGCTTLRRPGDEYISALRIDAQLATAPRTICI